MAMFKSKLANRLTIAKTTGFLIGLLGFFVLPYVFPGSDYYLRFAILFWYTTVGVILGLMGYMTVHPVFSWFKMPWWFRGIWMGGWLNFVIALFMYHTLGNMMAGTMFDGWSPFWLVAEGMLVGFIIELLATKCVGDGKQICE